MSLIVGILQNDFIMFCSDSRLNGYDQKKYLVQKIFKLNDNLMYATGGDKESIDNILDKAISVCEENVSYREFSNIVEDIFRSLPLSETKNISLFIGEVCGNKLSMKELLVLNHELICNIYNTPVDIPIRRLATGQANLHIDTIKTYFPFGKEMTITEIKDAVKKVLDLGCMIDDEIDNEMQYEYIKKGVT
ncbi:Ntn hydrolase family protein [Enterocloster alcoholdehydrogenati]|uniref:hypothetical protein n=1 Tax=Enterocloster alcoholdehydrogenati TaxID=2547410 RepID=UPI00159332EA|nr:hypothetical protein [Enterocloster alcoholdehydrogenati]